MNECLVFDYDAWNFLSIYSIATMRTGKKARSAGQSHEDFGRGKNEF
jgi:hypothetical protein